MDKTIKAARLADQIRDYVAVWSQQDLQGYIFSITQVTLSLDLSEAIIWVDITQKEHQKLIFATLKRNEKKYQRKLNKLPSKLAMIKISFRLDESDTFYERFDELLKS